MLARLYRSSSHEQERNEEHRAAFLRTFASVKADNGTVAMGVDDEALDRAFQHISLKEVPRVYEDENVPLPPKIQEKTVEVIEEKAENIQQPTWEQVPHFPYVRRVSQSCQEHDNFNKLFDHVPDCTKPHYGGQAYQPDLQEIDLAQVPACEESVEPDIETGLAQKEAPVEQDIPQTRSPRRSLSKNSSILSRFVGGDYIAEHTPLYEQSHKLFEMLYKEPPVQES